MSLASSRWRSPESVSPKVVARERVKYTLVPLLGGVGAGGGGFIGIVGAG